MTERDEESVDEQGEETPLTLLLKQIRRDAGRITQEEAASRVSQDRTVWNKWENDERSPDETNRQAISDAFGVARAELDEAWRRSRQGEDGRRAIAAVVRSVADRLGRLESRQAALESETSAIQERLDELVRERGDEG